MKLSESEFLATFAEPMARVTTTAGAPFEFWPYFEAIPADDFESHDCSACQVSYVWNSSDGRFQHVLVNSEETDVFMALVLDLTAKTVVGHRLLNMTKEYGLHP